jgi:hypothetical protein
MHMEEKVEVKFEKGKSKYTFFGSDLRNTLGGEGMHCVVQIFSGLGSRTEE